MPKLPKESRRGADKEKVNPLSEVKTMQKGELVMLALALDLYRVQQNEEMHRLLDENKRLRIALGHYRLIENITR